MYRTRILAMQPTRMVYMRQTQRMMRPVPVSVVVIRAE